MPLALVVSISVVFPFANVPLACVAGALNVTTTALTGFEPLSSTVATSGAANAVLIGALCGVPLVAVIAAGAPAMFVRSKLAGVDTPATLAVTVSAPDVPFAVNAAEVATPLALVIAVVTLVVVSANMPLANDAGAVNVTIAPLTGFWPLSTTVATSGTANAALIAALCGVPLVAAIAAGAPVVFVRLKLASVRTPETAAVTV
jgi:hypothetical protein